MRKLLLFMMVVVAVFISACDREQTDDRYYASQTWNNSSVSPVSSETGNKNDKNDDVTSSTLASSDTQGEQIQHIHNYKPATCTQPKTCSCGDIFGVANGHSWNNATCTAPKQCKTCGVIQGTSLGHSWQNATCSKAKECKVCGATQGSAAGHNWRSATCTAPKQCRTCGVIQGTALGHTWKNATCYYAKECKVCGVTQGSALGHNWEPATYTSPKKCKLCGLTSGEPLVKKFTGITINTLPAKTKFNVGEAFSDKGLTIRKNYSDGSYETISDGFTTIGFTSTTVGKKTITVEYVYRSVKYTTSFDISIVIEDIALSEITAFERKGVLPTRENAYDTFGNYYDRCISFYGDDYQKPYAMYHLNGNYNRLIGTFAVEEGSFKYSSNNVIINIYADDVLVYTKDHIVKFTEPFYVDIDIKHCTFLKIQITTNYCCDIIFANAQIKK